MQRSEFDVVAVGAGPAGASAARAAAELGVSVLLIDSKHRPGSPVQCAEYVPQTVRKYAPLAPGSVVQRIDRLLTFFGDTLATAMAGPGYILNRAVFDRSLVQRAEEAGAVFRPAVRALARTGEGLIIRSRDGAKQEIKCKVIIGADGPQSTVGQWMNSRNQKFMLGLQYRLPLSRSQSSTDIYFKPEYEGGYAWVFPKGEYANVGVGVNMELRARLPLLVSDFIGDLVVRGQIADWRPREKTAGLIPVGGPLAVTQRKNMLLAGDAAGQTHPVTGGGIMNAIVAGDMAGESAARAVIYNDLTLLEHYPRQWQAFLGRYLERAVRQRQDMDQNWTYHAQDFETLIRRTWIGFCHDHAGTGQVKDENSGAARCSNQGEG